MFKVGAITAINALVAFLGIAVYTRLMDARDFGSAMLWTGVLSLFDAAALAPFSYALLKHLPRDSAANCQAALLREFWRFGSRMILTASAVLLAGGLFCLLGWAGSWTDLVAFALVLVLFVMALPYRIAQTQLTLAEKPVAIAWTHLIETVCQMAGIVAVVMATRPDCIAFLAGMAVGRLLSYVMLALFSNECRYLLSLSGLRQDLTINTSIDYRRFYVPLVLSALIGWLASMGDRYVIGGLAGLGVVGYFAAALGFVSRPYAIVTATLTTHYKPTLFAAASTETRRPLLRAWFGFALGIGFAGVLGFATLGPWISNLYFPAEYAVLISPLLPVLAVASAFTITTHVADNALIAQGRTSVLLSAQCASLVIYLLAAFWLIREGGLEGAAWARLIGQAGQLALTGLAYFGRFRLLP